MTVTVLQLSQQYKEEAELLRKAIKMLEGYRDVKIMRICDRYQKGYSDLFICVGGILVCAELKDDEGVATPHQELFIAEVIRAGGIGGTCRTLGEVQALVDEARRRLRNV